MTQRCRLVWALASAILLLSACAEKWAKPGGTAAEFEALKASCGSRAYAKFPPYVQQVMVSAGYYTPVQESCSLVNGMRQCLRMGGNYVPPQFDMIDHNEAGREQETRACFFEHGWQPVRN